MAERVGRASDPGRGRIAWVALGVAGLAGGTLLGWQDGSIDALVTPPALVRAALVAASVVLGLALLGRAIARIETGRGLASAELSGHDLAQLVRGVRYVFLAVAAFSAGAGWLLGHPLPLIVALIIAGVDVLETSLLLLVVATRRNA